MKHMSAVGSVLGAKGVVLVRLHYVEPGLVLVHGVQDDLGSGGIDNTATEIEALVVFVSEFGQMQLLSCSRFQFLVFITTITIFIFCFI